MYFKPEIKPRVVAALKSGEYPQGFGSLRSDLGYCCLGVICDIAAQDSLSFKWESPQSNLYRMEEETKIFPIQGRVTALPESIARYATTDIYADKSRRVLVEGLGRFTNTQKKEIKNFLGWGREPESLAELNDARVSFQVIAEVIEKFC